MPTSSGISFSTFHPILFSSSTIWNRRAWAWQITQSPSSPPTDPYSSSTSTGPADPWRRWVWRGGRRRRSWAGARWGSTPKTYRPEWLQTCWWSSLKNRRKLVGSHWWTQNWPEMANTELGFAWVYRTNWYCIITEKMKAKRSEQFTSLINRLTWEDLWAMGKELYVYAKMLASRCKCHVFTDMLPAYHYNSQLLLRCKKLKQRAIESLNCSKSFWLLHLAWFFVQFS